MCANQLLGELPPEEINPLRRKPDGFFVMPIAAAKPCRKQGCSALVRDGGGYCQAHKREVKQQVEQRRESSTKRGYGYKWQQAREQFLREHPLCECPDCLAGQKRTIASSVVDHKIPHKGDMKLFWDRSNWQAMSKRCHDSKTAREDGRWG
jgi:5-methylcytosine-specific restriction protein A